MLHQLLQLFASFATSLINTLLGFGFIHSTNWFWLLFALYGVYNGLTKGVEKALVADVAPKNLKATMMGMYSGDVFNGSWAWLIAGIPAHRMAVE